MNNELFSLSLLTFFIITTLSWLVLRTLKEGNKGLNEMKKEKKKEQKIMII